MSNKLKRRLFFLLTITFSLVIPSAAVAVKFKLLQAYIRSPNATKVSITVAIGICIIFITNLGRIRNYLKESPFSIYKCVVNGMIKFIPLACLMLLLINLEKWITNIKYAYFWYFWCNLVALFIFEPLWHHYTEEFKFDIEYKKKKIREEIGVK